MKNSTRLAVGLCVAFFAFPTLRSKRPFYFVS